ncbi:MAG TPA: hypothetical protein VK400_19175 [Pyrinomonadaceae bacterium]|nr:hypothetical protein [Pyrinomonadaceae bacterium]
MSYLKNHYFIHLNYHKRKCVAGNHFQQHKSGQTVRRLQDASGGVVEVVSDSAGRIVSSRIVSGAGAQPR